MADETVRAAINLHAVLRAIEDLCLLDEKAAAIVRDKKLGLRFSVPGVEKLLLRFNGQGCEALAGDHPADMNLRFTSPLHFNLMIEGKKNPLPTKGFRHIGFLKNEFSKLAQILASYLKPDPARLAADRAFRNISTILTAYTAFFALAQIGNHDKLGRLSAGRIEDGSINIEIKSAASVHIQALGGRLTTCKGLDADARASMLFDSLDTAEGILRGSLDSYACIGNGALSIRGRIPMIDNLNKLLGLVAVYLG